MSRLRQEWRFASGLRSARGEVGPRNGHHGRRPDLTPPGIPVNLSALATPRVGDATHARPPNLCSGENLGNPGVRDA
jgi:hypothetical protein